MPDLRGGHQLEHGVHHAETGSQDRHQADSNAELVRIGPLHRRADFEGTDLDVGQGFVAQQPGELSNDFTELLGFGPFVSQDRELVQDRGVA